MKAMMFDRFASVLTSEQPAVVRDPRLLIENRGPIKIYYAPFEHINTVARIGLVGITPGPTQMVNANTAARTALKSGRPALEALEAAKRTASFSGGRMRTNLINQLNHWGIHTWLGIANSSELFTPKFAQFLHTTSLLRFPVFVNGQDYGGTPDMIKDTFLRKHLLDFFAEEVKELKHTIFLGLGPEVQRVLNWLVVEGVLDAERVVGGMLHPSPNNTYRIDYLIGPQTEKVPYRTNPEPYNSGRSKFVERYLTK